MTKVSLRTIVKNRAFVLVALITCLTYKSVANTLSLSSRAFSVPRPLTLSHPPLAPPHHLHDSSAGSGPFVPVLPPASRIPADPFTVRSDPPESLVLRRLGPPLPVISSLLSVAHNHVTPTSRARLAHTPQKSVQSIITMMYNYHIHY